MRHIALRSVLALLSLNILATFALTQTPTGTPVTPALKLEIGKTLKGDLAGGGLALFGIAVRDNQLLDLIVEQHGIDVAVTLFGAGGEVLAKVDSPNGDHGPEPITIISPKGGEYVLKLESSEMQAPVGRYEVTIRALRDSTPRDRDRVAGLKLYYEGIDLEQKRDEASVRGAIKRYEAAAPLLHNGDDLKMEAESLNNIGLLYHELGESEKAFPYLARSLAINREIGRALGEAENLINIGAAYDNLSEPQKALDHYALAIKALKGEHPETEAIALSNSGKIYVVLGEYPKAVDHISRSIEILNKTRDRAGQAFALTNLGAAYGTMGEDRKAIEVYQKALELAIAANYVRLQGAILNNMGRIYSSVKDAQLSLDYLNRALEIRRKTGDRNGEISTLNNLGVAYDAMGQPEKGREFLNRAMEVSRSIGDKMSEAKVLFSLAGVERQNKNLVEAKNNLEAALANLESLRTQLANRDLRTAFFAATDKYYGAYIATLMELHKGDPSAGYDARALEASERARARALLEILTEAGVDIRQGASAQLLEREARLQTQLNERAEQEARIGNDVNAAGQRDELKKEIGALTRAYSDLKTEVRRNSTRYSSLIEPVPLTVGELQRDVLDAGTVLLEYSLGEERSFLWVVTSTTIDSYELPKRSEIESVARRAHGFLNDGKGSKQSVNNDSQYIAAAEQLSKILLAPAASHLGSKRLLVVADGALQYVPFGGLPPPHSKSKGSQQFLAVTNEIVSVPSASSLRALRRESLDRAPTAGSIAIFADPVFTANDERITSGPAAASKKANVSMEFRTRTLFERAYNVNGGESALPISRLPFTRREADAILGLAPARSSFKATDFIASRATVMGTDLSKYRIVHFATHGILHAEHPELSGIVLSLVNQKGEPVNGFLRLNEIYDLKLNADLVVLSACQTALGKEVRGEGLIGLTRGFMYAGSPRVVASLWKVDDVATAEFMKIFYEKMLLGKMRPAAALRAAKIAMMKQKRWSSPYYWAAFELHGEWR